MQAEAHDRPEEGMQSGPARLASLTAREQQIAAAVAEGLSNRDIAAALGITEQTVKNHLTSIFDKLQVRSRLQLALAVLKTGV